MKRGAPSGLLGTEFRFVRCKRRHLYRFSEDLDFTLLEETSWEDIEQSLTAAFDKVWTQSGVQIHLDHLDRHAHENSRTFYLAYDGPLPGAAGKTVKTDITIRELLILPVDLRPLLRGYPEYHDLPEDARIAVYSLDEVAIEKTVGPPGPGAQRASGLV